MVRHKGARVSVVRARVAPAVRRVAEDLAAELVLDVASVRAEAGPVEDSIPDAAVSDVSTAGHMTVQPS